MAIVNQRDQRTHANKVRSDSQPVRSDSHQVRIDAKQEFLAAINETKTRLGLSVESMAECAGVPISSMSDALNGKEGRNFAGHWLTAQGDDFEAMYNRVVDERRGLSREAKRARIARNLGELVRRVVEDLEEIA